MKKIQFYVKVAPGDGSCFFHAVGHQCNFTANQLRKLCGNLLLLNKDRIYNGLTLKEWVSHEWPNLTFEKYTAAISQGNFWGGTVEMFLLSEHLKRSFVVYKDQKNGTGKKILYLVTDTKEPEILLFFNGINHYDALEIRECNGPRKDHR